MTPFEAYGAYIALVRHFTSDYDYERFSGKTRVRRSTFDKRRDQYWFQKIADHHDPRWLMIATLVENPHAWVGEIARAEELYAARKGRVESLDYALRRELESVAHGSDDLCLAAGRHPGLAKKVLASTVSLECAAAVSRVTGAGKLWSANADPILRDLGRRIWKYETFVPVSDATRALVERHFSSPQRRVDTAA